MLFPKNSAQLNSLLLQISERKRTILSKATDPPTWEEDAVNGTNMRGDFTTVVRDLGRKRCTLWERSKDNLDGKRTAAAEGSTTVRRCCLNPPTAQSTARTPTS